MTGHVRALIFLTRRSEVVRSNSFTLKTTITVASYSRELQQNMLPQDAQVIPPWRASMSVLHVLAISSTVFRLFQRSTSKRLWYDDYTALFSVIMDCVLFVALHVGTVCFLLVSWSAKVSLALAIARIFPPGRKVRRFAVGMAWSFGLLGIAALLGVTISCRRDTSWHDSPDVQCAFPKVLVIPTFCAAQISDALLVFVPFRMLRRMKLPDEQRRLVLAGFAASTWTNITAVICFVLMLGTSGRGLSRGTLLHHAMASVSLMVCNSMVIVAYVYRLVRSDKDLEHSISEAASNGSYMSPLTTVVLTDFESSDGLSQNSYRRGTSYNSHPFSERNVASFNPSSLPIPSRIIPLQTSRFSV
ncbi:hypothetical protein BD779DRAFT_1676374 [Infundibulicybe gibba]|nr:hypothetical protein BD779DRAFT_1676374 [Infundibulicybe gibba]